MPDAVASSTDRSREVDSQRPSREVQDQPQDVEVACPHCGRPTAVSVSNARAELRVRPYLAAFGEHTTAQCADGHEFWIYYC